MSILFTIVLSSTILGISLMLVHYYSYDQVKDNGGMVACRNPRLRIGWHQLSRDQQIAYIQAVKCLQATPSQRDSNVTRYDDFPWVHRHAGVSCRAFGL